MNLTQPPPEGSSSSTIPKNALIAMLIIIGVMALLSLYANIQHWRRDKIDSVRVIPAGSPSQATP